MKPRSVGARYRSPHDNMIIDQRNSNNSFDIDNIDWLSIPLERNESIAYNPNIIASHHSSCDLPKHWTVTNNNHSQVIKQFDSQPNTDFAQFNSVCRRSANFISEESVTGFELLRKSKLNASWIFFWKSFTEDKINILGESCSFWDILLIFSVTKICRLEEGCNPQGANTTFYNFILVRIFWMVMLSIT